MIFAIIFLIIAVILFGIFIFLNFLSKKIEKEYSLHKQVLQNQVIPFMFDIVSDNIEFYDRIFLYDYAKKIPLSRFLNEIISLNRKDIEFWFQNIWKAVNNQNSMTLEIKVSKGSYFYELKLLNYDNQEQKIYLCLYLLNNMGLHSDTQSFASKNLLNNVKRKSKTTHFLEIFDFINIIEKKISKFEKKIFKKKKKKYLLIFLKIDSKNESNNKYYIRIFNEMISFLIKNILENHSIKRMKVCQHKKDEYLFLSKNNWDEAFLDIYFNQIEEIILRRLNHYSSVLDIYIHFGAFGFDSTSAKIISAQKIISLSRSAYMLAKKENTLYKIFTTNDYIKNKIPSSEKNIDVLSQQEWYVDIKLTPIYNILSSKLEANLLDISLRLLSNKEKIKEINVFEYLTLANKLLLISKKINEIIPNYRTPIIIKIPFNILFHNLSQFISLLKKIDHRYITISFSKYSFYDVEDIKWCLDMLFENNINAALHNFKFFNNSITFIKKLNLQYIFFDNIILNSLINSENKRVQMISLQMLAKNLKIRFVAENISSTEQQLLACNLGFNYGTGNLVVIHNNDPKMHKLFVKYYNQSQQFKLVKENYGKTF